MNRVLVVLASLVLLADVGAFRARNERIARAKAGSDSGMSTQFPVPKGGCELGTAYGKTRACVQQPWLPIPHCSNASWDEACSTEIPYETAKVYTRNVHTQAEFTSLMSATIDFEAGGYGKKIGIGFGYLQDSKVTRDSIAFFIGAGGKTRLRQISQPGSLKLGRVAKSYLTHKPEWFLQTFGFGYVNTIADGGSFLGSFTVNTQDSIDTTDITAYVKASYSTGVYTMSGSAEFQRITRTKTGRVSIHADAQTVGGSGIVVKTFNQPSDMARLFRKWQLAWRHHPAPITAWTRRWLDSVDVQAIVLVFPDHLYQLFVMDSITPFMQKIISEENAKNKRLMTTAQRAIEWKGNQTWRHCLTPLLSEIETKQMMIDTELDDLKALQIGIAHSKGNFSFFQANDFESKFLHCVGGAEKLCAGRSKLLCPEWQSYAPDDRYDWCFRVTPDDCFGDQSRPTILALNQTIHAGMEEGEDENIMIRRIQQKWPGYEWLVWGINMHHTPYHARLVSPLHGLQERGDDRTMFAMGLFCPSAPWCGRCDQEHICLRNELSWDEMKPAVERARQRCRPRGLFALEGGQPATFASYARGYAERCFVRGSSTSNRVFAANFYTASVLGAASSVQDVGLSVLTSRGNANKHPLAGADADLGSSKINGRSALAAEQPPNPWGYEFGSFQLR